MSLSVDGVVQHVRSRCPCSRVWHLRGRGTGTQGGNWTEVECEGGKGKGGEGKRGSEKGDGKG